MATATVPFLPPNHLEVEHKVLPEKAQKPNPTYTSMRSGFNTDGTAVSMLYSFI
jgi:hypothetical protein